MIHHTFYLYKDNSYMATIDHLHIPDLILKLYILIRVISLVVKKGICSLQEEQKDQEKGI